MNSILKKMLYKGQSPVLLVNAPAEFETTRGEFEGDVDDVAGRTYDFTLAFVRSAQEAESAAAVIKSSASADALIWVAYPKGTSKRYKAGVNRDSLHALMDVKGLTGVTLVSIDDDWSAMRFKAAP